MWIDYLRERSGPIAEGCAYRLSTASPKAGLKAREEYSGENNIEYVVHDVQEPFGSDENVDSSDKFDVIILKVSHVTAILERLLEGARDVLFGKGYLILVQDPNISSEHSLCVPALVSPVVLISA